MSLVTFGRTELSPDDISYLEFPENKYILFNKETGKNIGLGRIISIKKKERNK